MGKPNAAAGKNWRQTKNYRALRQSMLDDLTARGLVDRAYLDISGLRPSLWRVEQVTAPAPSTNAELSGLKIGALTLSPEFAGATTSYAATTTNATNVITALPADAGAEIEILVDAPVAESYEIDNGTAVTWETGETTVTINVTAADGATTKAYTVTVTRS